MRYARTRRVGGIGRSGWAGVELLERRWLSSAGAGFPPSPVPPTPPGPTSGLTPAQIRKAYGIDQVSFGNVVGDGRGQTIAIVDPGISPTVATDLQVFDAAFGLAAPASFTQLLTPGAVTGDSGEVTEIALDVEWAHAVAPGASILLVETGQSFDEVLAGVGQVRNVPGVTVVSMSWGLSGQAGSPAELADEASFDSNFTTPAGHAGITFVSSSGDSGQFSGVGYPAISPNVLAVGGTTLTLGDSSGTYGSERAWLGSSGGVSAYEPVPTYQAGLGVAGRANPDVAFDGDPQTGVSVYTGFHGAGWEVVGGTSLGAPAWAGLVALADQGRAVAGLGPMDGATQTLHILYALPAADFHDVTTGLGATAGYDLATGLGTPVANRLVEGLVGATTGVPPPPTPPVVPMVPMVGVDMVVVGAAAGYTGSDQVRVFDAGTKTLMFTLDPFPGYTGGVAVTEADINGDGVKEIVAAPLTGSGLVEVFDAVTQQAVWSFMAFDPAYMGGLSVAAGDLGGSGHDDVIVSPRTGNMVEAFDGVTRQVVWEAQPFGPTGSAGLVITAGDLRGVGRADLLVASGVSGEVVELDALTREVVWETTLGGAFAAGAAGLAAADFAGVGHAELVVGSATGGEYEIIDGTTHGVLADAAAFGADYGGPVLVAAGTVVEGASPMLVLAAGAGMENRVLLPLMGAGGEYWDTEFYDNSVGAEVAS